MLGVDVVRVDAEFDAQLEPLQGAALAPAPDAVATASRAYVLDAEILRSYEAANRLLAAGASVYRSRSPLTAGGREYATGAFLVAAGPDAHVLVRDLSSELRLPVAVDPEGPLDAVRIEPTRVGLFKPWRPSMDEGWTRYVFDDFDFPYENVDNAAIRAGNLVERFEVILIPAQISLETLIEGRDSEDTPEPYAGGIGDEGVEALREFVEAGGTLITIERSDAVALEKLEVPVLDTLQDRSQQEFFYSASLVNLEVDRQSPLGWGMSGSAKAFFGGGRAYATSDWLEASDRVKVVASVTSTWPGRAPSSRSAWARDASSCTASAFSTGPRPRVPSACCSTLCTIRSRTPPPDTS
jgi:hypothetical protein